MGVEAISKILEPDTVDESEPELVEGEFEAHLSTESANYHMNMGHEQENPLLDEETVLDTDAIVLEEAFHRYEHLGLEDLHATPHHEGILGQNFDHHNLPVYVADMPETNRFDYEDNFKRNFRKGYILPALIGGAGIAAGIPEAGAVAVPPAADWIAEKPGIRNVDSKAMRETLALTQLSRLHTSFGMRSAIVAEKLETGIAPDLDEEKPNIAVNYGLSHHDMMSYLRFPRLRETVIEYGRRRDFEGKDEEYLDKVCVFEPDEVYDEDSGLTPGDYSRRIFSID